MLCFQCEFFSKRQICHKRFYRSPLDRSRVRRHAILNHKNFEHFLRRDDVKTKVLRDVIGDVSVWVAELAGGAVVRDRDRRERA